MIDTSYSAALHEVACVLLLLLWFMVFMVFSPYKKAQMECINRYRVLLSICYLVWKFLGSHDSGYSSFGITDYVAM
jgi:hypothetical protein